MTPEAKFRDPEIHCLKFGDLSDIRRQLRKPPVNFSPATHMHSLTGFGTTFASPCSPNVEVGRAARCPRCLAASGPIGDPRARHATARKAGDPRAVRVGLLEAVSSHVSKPTDR
jgi:hypothetical protein